MRLNIIALSVTAGLFWGAAIFIVAVAHAIWPGYGGAFLEFAASIYSGYDPGPGIGSIIVGTLYGMVDGAIAGAVFAWLYNYLARKFPGASD
jgi:ABC-type phosphate transport system permease subunit